MSDGEGKTRLLGDFKQGIAGQIAADDWQAHFDLGVAYAEMGVYQEAIEEFEAVLRVNPGHAQAQAELIAARIALQKR
jgi:tetratricopeptide (TPR) repeat protein